MMKSVSFLRNTWRKRGEQKPVDSGRGDTQALNQEAAPDALLFSCAGAVDFSAVDKLPVLHNTPPLQEGLGLWIEDPRQEAKAAALCPKQVAVQQPRLRDRSVSGKESSSNLRDLASHGHGAPVNSSHGPPRNAMHGPKNIMHGPPGLTVQSSGASASSLPDFSLSLRRSHRPPRITVHPPIQRQSTTSVVSLSTNPRSPTRVKFALPHEGSPHSSRSYLPSRQTHAKFNASSSDSLSDSDDDDTLDCDCVKVPSPGHGYKHHYRCASRYRALENSGTAAVPGSPSDSPSRRTKTVHAVLDLSAFPKPRTLYHSTGSTPFLPYVDGSSSRSRAVDPTDDPLSQFPAPPPLVIRRRIPQPLILRPTPSIAPLPPSPCYSSCDSTPPTTPTTPRPQLFPSYPKAASPTSILKHSSSRVASNIPPPLFSAPTSPLPSPPIPSNSPSHSPDHGSWANTRPLRIAKSTSHLRNDVPPPSATHRLTSSEPLSQLPSSDRVDSRRRVTSRPEPARIEARQVHLDSNERIPASMPSSEPPIQWGYAF